MAAPETTVNSNLLTTNFSTNDDFLEYCKIAENRITCKYTHIKGATYLLQQKLPSGEFTDGKFIFINALATQIFKRKLSECRGTEKESYVRWLNAFLGINRTFEWYTLAAFRDAPLKRGDDSKHYISIRVPLLLSKLKLLKMQHDKAGNCLYDIFEKTLNQHLVKVQQKESEWKPVRKEPTPSVKPGSSKAMLNFKFVKLSVIERIYEEVMIQANHPRKYAELSLLVDTPKAGAKVANRDDRLRSLDFIYNKLSKQKQEAIDHEIWKLISEERGFHIPKEDTGKKARHFDPNFYKQAIIRVVSRVKTSDTKTKPLHGVEESKESETVAKKKTLSLADAAWYLEIKRCLKLKDKEGISREIAPNATTGDEVIDWIRASSESLKYACTLSIKNSKITYIPKDFLHYFTYLLDISITSTNLISLHPEQFKGLECLQTINLSKNKIAAIPAGVFNGLSELLYLDLSGNLIEALPPKIFETGIIRHLYLHDNIALNTKSLTTALNTKTLSRCYSISVDPFFYFNCDLHKAFNEFPKKATVIVWNKFSREVSYIQDKK